MDRYSFTKSACVKSLVVPVNSTTRTNFAGYFDLLCNYNHVRLLDLGTDTPLQFFNPQLFPNGRIFFDFLKSVPDNDTLFLHDFEPFRINFVVVGAGTYTPDTDFALQLAHLKKLHPSCQVHSLIIFDAPPGLTSKTRHVYFHNGSLSHNVTALETILCEVAQTFLAALDAYALSYKNITLRSPVSITDSHILTKTINQAQKRLSSGSLSFKASFASSSPSPDSNSKSQLRHSGRQAKLMGNFYLLAGNYANAFTSFTESLLNLKKSDDFLWLGGALEGLAVTLILLHYVGSTYELPRQKLCQVLQISSKKLPTITPLTPNNHLNRLSSESVAAIENSQTSITSPRSSTSNLGYLSPRNSISSLNGIPDITSLALPQLIKLICNKALHYYHLSTNDYENMVPDIVYVESILRLIKFMVTIYLGGNAFNALVLESIVTSAKLQPVKGFENTHFLKSDILKEIDKIFSLQLVDMSIVEQCRIYCSLAATYSDLGLSRKRAFILRVLLVSLVPKLQENQILNLKDEFLIQETLQSTTSFENQYASIREIFQYLFEVYGVPIDDESSKGADMSWTAIQIPLLKLSLKISESIGDYQFTLKLCSILLSKFTHCLSNDYQVSLKDKVDLLLRLSDHENHDLQSQYWDPYLVRDVDIMSNRHNDLIPFDEYQKANGNVGLMGTTDVAKTSATLTKQPLLFDPYNKSKTNTLDKHKLLIRDEIYHLKVQLQNPFAFDIEVSNLSIVTEQDCQVVTLKSLTKPFNSVYRPAAVVSNRPNGIMNKVRSNQGVAKAISPSASSTQVSNSANPLLVIPRKSCEYFQVSFRPLKTGDLKILGFKASVSDCVESFFPTYDLEFNSEKSTKFEGPNSGDTADTNIDKPKISVKTKSLNLKVISPQPNLALTNILITNSWAMLLEGEKYVFSVDLTNYSSETINYLSFSFWDSTIGHLKKRLELSTGNQTLPAPEVYELEWLMLKCSPFRIINKEEIMAKYKTINPQGELKLNFELTGKRGIKQLKIILEYCCKDLQDSVNSFVKNVTIPISVSIFPSFEILACDFMSLYSFSFKDFSALDGFEMDNVKRVVDFIKDQEDLSQYCVMVLDMKNSWNDKLIGSLNYKSTGFNCEETIEPNKTRRFLVPIQRIDRKHVDFTKPIPSLRDKQFIKNYSISEDEEKQMRQLFWLRIHVLENLVGSWKTLSSKTSRHGVIDFRSIRITPKMSQVLISENINIVSEIVDDSSSEGIGKNGNKFMLEMDKFYKILTTIINQTEESIQGVLRHLPIAINCENRNQVLIDKKILINGILQRDLGCVGILPGEQLKMELGFVVIEKGEYEWGVVLDIKGKRQIVGRESIFISAS